MTRVTKNSVPVSLKPSPPDENDWEKWKVEKKFFLVIIQQLENLQGIHESVFVHIANELVYQYGVECLDSYCLNLNGKYRYTVRPLVMRNCHFDFAFRRFVVETMFQWSVLCMDVDDAPWDKTLYQFTNLSSGRVVRIELSLSQKITSNVCAMAHHAPQLPRQRSLLVISGRVETIIGSMYSGKTTELLRRIRTYAIAKHETVVLKYMEDRRQGEPKDVLVTHGGDRYPAVPCGKYELGSKDMFNNVYSKYSVIGIDEGQFFPDLAEVANALADAGKIVIVACLNGTFLRQPFPQTSAMIACSETVTHLKAVCIQCSAPAIFSKRLIEATELEVIGGPEAYEARCRKCFGRTDVF